MGCSLTPPVALAARARNAGFQGAACVQDEKDGAEMGLADSVVLPKFMQNESFNCPTGMGWERPLFWDLETMFLSVIR